MENYLNFENLAHVIHYGLQGFIAKNIESESTILIIFYRSGSVTNPDRFSSFFRQT